MKGFFQRIQESHSGSRKQKNDPQPSYQIWVPPAAKPNVDGNRAQKETLYYTADGQRTTTSRRPPLGSNTVYEPHVPTTGYDYMTYPSTGSGYPIPDHRYPVHVAPSSNSISGQYPSVPSRNQPLAASALPPPKPWNQYAQVTPTVHREDDPRHHKASGSRDTDRERQGKRELRARERAPTVEKYGTENPTHHESTQRDEKRRTMKDEGGEREARERRRDARKEDKDRESKDRKEKDRRRKEKEKDGGSDREIDWGRNRDREREHERSGKHKKERHLPRDTMADYRIVDSEPERNWTSGRERDPTKDLRRPPIQESRRREDLEQVRTGKAKGKEVLAGERQDKTNPVAGVSQDWRTEGFSTHLQNNKDRGERDVQSYYKRHDRAQVSDLHERRPDRRENNHSYLDKRVEPDSGAWHPVSMSQDQPVARKQHSQRDETTSDSSPRMDLPKRSKHKRHLTDSETPHLTDTSLPRASSASSLTKPQRTNTNLNHLPLERSRNHVIPSEPPVQNGLQASSVPVHILQKYHSREQDIVPDKSSNTRNKNNEPTTLSSRWPFFKRNSSQKPPASFVETAPAQHVSSSKPDKQSTSRTATAGPSIQQAQLSHGVSKATEQLLAPAAGKHSKRYSSDVLNPVETSKTPNVVYDHHLSVLGLSKIPSASISGPSPTSLIQHEPRSQETTGYPLPRSVQPTLGMKSVNSTTESFAGPQLPVQSSSREKLFSSHVDAYSRESNPQGANTRLIPVETLVSPGQRLGPPPTPDVQPTNTSPDSQIQAPLIPSHPLSRSQGNMPVLTPFGQSQVPRNEPLHVSPILESERHVQIPALPSTGRSSSGTTPTQHENARRLPEEHGHSNQLHKPPSRDFGPTENGLKHPQAASIYPTTTQQRMGGPTNRSQDSVLGTQYRSSTADKGFLQPSVIAPILTSDRSHPPAVQTVNQERESLTTEAPLPNAFTRVSHTDNPSGVTARDVHLLAHEQFRTYSNSVAPNSSMTPKPRHADVKASGEVASTNDNRLDIISQQPPRPSTTLGYRQGNAEPLVHSASGAHLDNRTLGSIIQRPGTAMSFSKYAVDRPHIYAAPVTVRDMSQTSILQVNPKDASTSRYDPLQSVVPQPNLYTEPSSVVDGNLLVRTGSKEQTVATSGSGLPQHKHVEPSYKTVQQLDTKAPGRLSSSHIPQEPSRMATSSQLHSTNVKTEDEPLVRNLQGPLPHQPIKGDVLVSQHGGVHDRITRTKAMTSSSTVQNSVLSVPPANGILTATAHGPPVTLLPFVPSRTMSNLESNATSNHGNLGAQMSLPALISPQIQKVHDGVHHVEQEQTQTLVASSPHVPIKGTDNVRSTGDPSISGVTAQYSNQGQITSQKPSRSKDQGKSSQKAVPSAVLHPDITYSLPPNSFPYVEPHQNTSNPQRSVPSPGIASATAYQQLVSSPTPLESPHNYRSSSHPAQRSDRQLAVPSKGSSGFHVGPSAARPAVPTSSEAPQPLHRSHPSMPSSSVNPRPPARIHAASRSTVPNPITNSQNGLSNDVAPRSVLLDMNAQSNNQIAQVVATSSRLKDRTPSTSGKASAESIPLKTPSSLTPTILKPTTSRTSIPASLSSQTSSRRRGLFGLFKPKDIQLPDPIQGDGQSRMLPRKIRKESKTNSKVESSKVASAVSQTIPPPIQVHIPILPTSGRKSPNKVFTPFRYLSTKRNRRVSEASLEAQDGTAPNTVIGSPTPSMHSSQPAAVHSPPLRDVYAATQQWRQMEAAGIREVAGGRLRRARPGVVFDVDEDRTEEDHRKFIQSQIR